MTQASAAHAGQQGAHGGINQSLHWAKQDSHDTHAGAAVARRTCAQEKEADLLANANKIPTTIMQIFHIDQLCCPCRQAPFFRWKKYAMLRHAVAAFAGELLPRARCRACR